MLLVGRQRAAFVQDQAGNVRVCAGVQPVGQRGIGHGGRIGRGPEAELVARYMKRVTWPHKITEMPDTGGKLPDLAPGTRRVMLDEKGDNLPSRVLAERLQAWRDDGVRETRFLIGAADGFAVGRKVGAADGFAVGTNAGAALGAVVQGLDTTAAI